ncbi:hypothetical protein R1sor_010878 [Riccia sorocarpa]|uniref:Uncharacterized protein n=1 Tax=Riccia sorocarpa TaxID=122646 RepID=A0ABD3I213_9MARC
MESHVPKLDYKLAIADVPYGFNFKDCKHEDKELFSLQNFHNMISSFASVTESDYWTMVIFHSLQQAENVGKALSDFGCSVVLGVWVKTNCKNAGGPRLVNNHEYFTVGFWSREGKMSMKHFGSSDTKQLWIFVLVLVPLWCVLFKLAVTVSPSKKYNRQFMFLPARVMLMSQKKLPNAEQETHLGGKHSVEVTIDPETLQAQVTSLECSQQPAEQLLALPAPWSPSGTVQDPASGPSELFPVAAGPSDPIQDPASGISAELQD